jgi:Ca2+-binding RTX toxin-like protein
MGGWNLVYLLSLRFNRSSLSHLTPQFCIAPLNTLLVGTDRDELINAGIGGVTVSGNGGQDDFLIANGSAPVAPVTIADFEIGSDRIGISGLSGVSQFQDLSLSAQENGTMVSGGGQDLAFLPNVSTNDLNASSFAINAM